MHWCGGDQRMGSYLNKVEMEWVVITGSVFGHEYPVVSDLKIAEEDLFGRQELREEF